MAEFTGKPLGILDRLYKFVGGLRGTSRVDLTTPITLVHDVSRQAEMCGSGMWLGRAEWVGACVCAAADTDIEILDVETGIKSVFNIWDDEFDLYVIGWSARALISQVGSVDLIAPGHGFDSTVSDFRRIQHYGSDLDVMEPYVSYAGSDFINWTDDSAAETSAAIYWRPYQPIRVPHKGYLAVRMDTSGIAQVGFRFELCAVPFGARPPGLP